MHPIQFETSLGPDGHIVLPEDVRKDLRLRGDMTVRISISIVQDRPAKQPDAVAWSQFAHLGDDAAPGGPPDLSAHHDRYLYDD